MLSYSASFLLPFSLCYCLLLFSSSFSRSFCVLVLLSLLLPSSIHHSSLLDSVYTPFADLSFRLSLLRTQASAFTSLYLLSILFVLYCLLLSLRHSFTRATYLTLLPQPSGILVLKVEQTRKQSPSQQPTSLMDINSCLSVAGYRITRVLRISVRILA